MPIAAVNGQNIYYEDTGGTGPAIIFSHGLFMDHAMFAPQVEALKGRWRCITWDERGHAGTASDTLAPFSYYDSADDLAALLKHLGIERAVLAGMSQGGFLSLRCALTHPQIVRALVLIDTQAGQEDPNALEGHMQLANTWATQGLSDEMAGIIEHIILGEGWAGAPAWKAKWKTIKPVNVLGCMQTLASRDDITPRLGEIKVPALVVHGDADAAISLDLAKTLTAGLPDAQLVVVPGAGHAANLTHPQVVNPAIERFLAGLG
ncbi:alpha/beta fold hydrolase [Caulobacter sp. KR2-114]|uniref:alpha/beta fold hydrolase n=1 Tax=Caulobacter sp. KR2-114 TaxID=3400912 RepID=UPI003C114B9F